jgi:DNA polymerase III alpha subunit
MNVLSPPPLFLRSHFSFLAGCRSPGDLLDAAVSAGYETVVLVDEGGFYGAPEFFREARHRGLKPLLGVSFPRVGVTLLCSSDRGFERANTIITRERRSETHGRRPALSGGVVADLADRGWDELLVLSTSRSVLGKLGKRSREGLYSALDYGKPIIKTAAFAREIGVGVFALTDTVWLHESDLDVCRVLESIAARAGGRRPARIQGVHNSLPEPACFNSFFSTVPSAAAASRCYAAAADLSGLFSSVAVFPRFRGFNPADEYTLLKRRCGRGAIRRYGGESRGVTRRIEHELRVIRRRGYAGYFLVVDDIVRRCTRSCGRGSAAGSVVCYVLGITQIDPLKHGLSFERFLSDSRVDPPDIDVDFPWDERRAALEYVFLQYPGRSGMVADHITFGPRSSLREAAKARGYRKGEVTGFVGLGLEGRLDKVPAKVRSLAEKLIGIPRHLGTHTGGVVITSGPIESVSHTQLSPGALPVIAYEKEGAREAGMVKIDLLGSRSLAVLRDAEALAGREKGRAVNLDSLRPTEDPKTQRLIQRGDTLGVFYIESPATRMVLNRMKLGDYGHLVAATSIIRPAAKEYVGVYLERLKGASWKPLHPRLIGTLKETLGLMVYQEDISRVAIDLCGFGPGEADALRKALSGRDRERHLPEWRKRFFTRGRRQGIDVACLRKTWGMILSFQGYSFCKAHSASYAGLAFKLAYLKVHFPLPYMTSVINNGGGFYGRQVYLNAVRRMGFSLLLPDVNRSFYEYSVEGDSLRVGLCQLRGLTGRFLTRLLAERTAGGPFTDCADFHHRLRPGEREVNALICSGSLDELCAGMGRQAMAEALSLAPRQTELFAAAEPGEETASNPGKKLADEMASLGLLITSHPVAPFRKRATGGISGGGEPPFVDSRGLSDSLEANVRILCYLAAGKEVETCGKDLMCFICFEDEYGLFQGVVYPRGYRRLLPELRKRRVFCAAGMVKCENGAPIFIVEHLRRP